MTKTRFTSPRHGGSERLMAKAPAGSRRARPIRSLALSMPGNRPLEEPTIDSIRRKWPNMRRLLCATCLSAIATAAAAQDDITAVEGTFQPLNPAGEGISGTVSISPQGETLVITLEAEGLSPGMHLAHVHGFPEADPADAACPDAAADANGDGWVDLIETQELAGVTMIPFTDDPAGLAIQSESYPSTGDDGRISYEQSVGLDALRDSLEAEFGTPLALPRRVVFVHGVPEGTELPGSVRSLEGVPASVTIPVACAELEASRG